MPVEVATLDTREARRLTFRNFERAYHLHHALMGNGYGEPKTPNAAAVDLNSAIAVREWGLLRQDFDSKGAMLLAHIAAILRAQMPHCQLRLQTSLDVEDGILKEVSVDLTGGADKHDPLACRSHKAFTDSRIALILQPDWSWIMADSGMVYKSEAEDDHRTPASEITLANEQLGSGLRSRVFEGILWVVSELTDEYLKVPMDK